jgi:hypothetical protein
MNITKTKKNCKGIRSTKEMEEQIGPARLSPPHFWPTVATPVPVAGHESPAERYVSDVEEPYTGEIDVGGAAGPWLR